MHSHYLELTPLNSPLAKGGRRGVDDRKGNDSRRASLAGMTDREEDTNQVVPGEDNAEDYDSGFFEEEG